MRTTCLMYFPSDVPDDGAMRTDGKTVERDGDVATELQAVNTKRPKSAATRDLIARWRFVARPLEFSLNSWETPKIEANALHYGTLVLALCCTELTAS